VNLKSFTVRTLVALVFGPLILVLVWLGEFYLFGLILVLVTLCYWEFTSLSSRKGALAQQYTGEIIGIATLTSLYFFPGHLFLLAIGATLLVLFGEIYRSNGSPLLNTATTLFGALYFSLLLGCFILIRQLPLKYGLDYHEAGHWIIMMILATWICDTAAYIIGSYFGRHKLIPRISPNKSVEGTVAGFCFAILSTYAYNEIFTTSISKIDAIAIGAIIGIFGQYGDLFESMFKRDAGVKDTSSLIPGHGGMMDRFDSLTISAPMVYLYLVYVAL